MWELMNQKVVPFSHFTQRNQFTSALADGICAGMRPEPDTLPGTPPAFSACMKKCWGQDPRRRGTFRTALATLCEIRDKLPKSYIVGYELHDLGFLAAAQSYDLVAVSAFQAFAMAIDVRGYVFRFDLRAGVGEQVGNLSGSLRNVAVLCCLPGGGALVMQGMTLLRMGTGGEDGSLRLGANVSLGKVEAAFIVASHLIIIGTSGPGLGQVCVLDSETLNVEQTVEFQLWGEILSIAHPTRDAGLGSDAEVVWILTGANVIIRFGLGSFAVLEGLEDLVVRPAEQECVRRLTFMEHGVVWGYGTAAVVIWRGAQVVDDFEWPAELGEVTDIVPATQNCALVASSLAISLWKVDTHESVAVFHIQKAQYPRLLFTPQLGGIFLAVGSRLRTFLISPETSSADYSAGARQNIAATPTPSASVIEAAPARPEEGTDNVEATEQVLGSILVEFELHQEPPARSTPNPIVLPVSKVSALFWPLELTSVCRSVG